MVHLTSSGPTTDNARCRLDLNSCAPQGTTNRPDLGSQLASVHAGVAFLGSIGVEGGNYQFAALGDSMNFGARLVGAAKGGEMIMSQAVWNYVSGQISAEPRDLDLKGYAEPVKAYVAKVTPA